MNNSLLQPLIPLDFSGNHVLVFGGTTGINFGIACAYARRGAKVTVASRSSVNVNAARHALEELGAETLGLCADVRDYAAVEHVFQEATARFGPVDVLVSGAAGNFLCAARDLSANGFKVVVDIDLVGTFHVMRAAFPHLRKPGASVINITAPQGSVPMRYQVHCGAAKAGIDQLTRILALEWGGDGVRINGISPGPIEATEGTKRLMSAGDDEQEQARRRVPLQRWGTAEDIANLALFLGSPYASFISGTIVSCDGGGALESVKPTIESVGAIAAAQRRADA
ncbi:MULTISPECIES: SDR family oxidoreductase [Burkholderia cepacia complex]|uniref:SDR family oxidoreductase n=1 Tax=Burkholderia cepacia complex TaxID=87882 RepID=UPI000D1ABAFA|nr:SDR family oxidoreductase [Burkholderia metallica]